MEVTATPLPYGRMQRAGGGWQHQNKASISAARNQASNNDHVNKVIRRHFTRYTQTNTHTYKKRRRNVMLMITKQRKTEKEQKLTNL